MDLRYNSLSKKDISGTDIHNRFKNEGGGRLLYTSCETHEMKHSAYRHTAQDSLTCTPQFPFSMLKIYLYSSSNIFAHA